MTPDQLNDDLANRLGRNAHGAGHYCWMHSEAWMHLMKTDRCKQIALPSGLIGIEAVYENRKMMIDVEDTWVLAHWHPPVPQYQWEAQNPRLLWPREGYYAPTNILLAQGQRPTPTDNEKAVTLIRKQGEKTMADLIADSNGIEERKEKRYKDFVSDKIDDAVSAFCNIPGTRGAHVSFPLPGSSQEKEHNVAA